MRSLTVPNEGCNFDDASTAHLGTQQLHAEHVQVLPLAVHRSHVDYAIQAEQCTNRCGSNAMLSRPRFCDDSFLADALRQESLSNGIIDLVCSCVRELFALEPDLAVEGKGR